MPIYIEIGSFVFEV